MPTDFTPFVIDDGRIAGVATDSLGVPRVAVYRVSEG